MNKNKDAVTAASPDKPLPARARVCVASAHCVLHAYVNVDVVVVVVGCCCVEACHNRGPCWALKPGALPEGTARLEEPLAGQQLNKRWEGSVSLEGHSCWEAPHLNAEDKQMLDETGRTEGKKHLKDKK